MGHLRKRRARQGPPQAVILCLHHVVCVELLVHVHDRLLSVQSSESCLQCCLLPVVHAVPLVPCATLANGTKLNMTWLLYVQYRLFTLLHSTLPAHCMSPAAVFCPAPSAWLPAGHPILTAVAADQTARQLHSTLDRGPAAAAGAVELPLLAPSAGTAADRQQAAAAKTPAPGRSTGGGVLFEDLEARQGLQSGRQPSCCSFREEAAR